MENADPPADRPELSESERVAQFVELYTQHYARLKYYLMTLVPTPSDAADVTQETSLVLWRKFHTFEIGTYFFAWACKIARLQVVKHYQRSNRSAKLFDPSTLELLSNEVMVHVDRSDVTLEILDSCFERLSEADQILIRRRYELNAKAKFVSSMMANQ